MTVQAEQLRTAADDELVRRFLEGERHAFEVLVLRHQNRVFGMCVRLLGSRTYAEEAAQEVFVKVYRNLERFRGDSRFTTWLYRVTLNHCRNVQAYRGRRHERRHDSLDAPIGDEDDGRRRELPSQESNAEQNMLTTERLGLLRQELDGMDPLWKEVLLLRDVEGLAYDEIGAALEIAPGTVKSRIHRARKELRTRLLRRTRELETER